MGAVSSGLLAHLLQGAPEIDWENPITEGLVFVSFGGGPELISGVRPLPIGAASRLGSNELGQTMSSGTNAADGWYWPLPPTHPLYSIKTADTLFVQMQRASANAYANTFGVPYRASTWANPFYAWGMSGQATPSNATVAIGTSASARVSLNSGDNFILSDNVLRAYGFTRNQTALRFYRGGAPYSGESYIAPGFPDFTNRQPPCLFNRSHTSLGEGATAQANAILVWNRAISPAEWRSIEEHPEQILKRKRAGVLSMRRTSSAPVIGALLAGDASTQISAAGTLSTGIALSGAAMSRIAASGSLTTSVRLAGAASCAIAGAGTLSTSIRLVGAAALQASAAGALTTAISLAGTASGRVAASGSLAGGAAALEGVAVVGVSAAGGLATSIQLAGTATVRTSMSGSMVGSGAALEGEAVARVSASGTLTTSILLVGAATTQLSAAGTLSGAGAPLTGTASVRALVDGTLSTGINLSGHAAPRVAASGALMTWVRLAGSASVRVSTAGSLGEGVRYARAPAGSGYTPQRSEYQSRPAQVDYVRPAAIQRNTR